MQNSKKNRNRITPLILSLVVTILLGGILTGCSNFSSDGPVVVSDPPTPVLDTATPEAAPTQEPPTPTNEEPAQATATMQPSPEPISQVSTFPDAGFYSWSVFASDLDRPLFLTHAGDQSGRIFVIEKAGRILIFQDGVQLEEPFLDIVQQVSSRDSERGLLGLAFHPEYAENGLFFINYTDLNGDTVIARYRVSDDKNQADPNSQQVLLNIGQPYGNHNGGMIAFGPDGYLYIGMGDGGAGGDPQGYAQNPNTLLGKMLRIDVDSGTPYSIPAGNAPNGRPEIWALGLRNPWRFSFDRSTGDLLVADVGQNQWEEINILPANLPGGLNLGWDYYEATHAFEGTPPEGADFIFPVIEYQHSGRNCSVTGGYTYRGTQLPDWQGVYLYGDYCSGTVWGAIPDADGKWETVQLFRLEAAIASFGEDENGELYLLDLSGKIFKLTQN